MKNEACIKRDNFYSEMMKKYNLTDWEDVTDVITDEENEIREELERASSTDILL